MLGASLLHFGHYTDAELERLLHAAPGHPQVHAEIIRRVAAGWWESPGHVLELDELADEIDRLRSAIELARGYAADLKHVVGARHGLLVAKLSRALSQE